MRRVIVLFVVSSFVALSSGAAFAAWFEKESEETAPAKTTRTTVTQTTPVATEEFLSKKKAELNGTIWNVEMRSAAGKGKVETDVISFADNKVMSKNLSTAGFPATNYSVRMDTDGTLIWETMQSSEEAGMAFWRGDIKDDVMRGVLVKRDNKEKSTEFSFVSVGGK